MNRRLLQWAGQLLACLLFIAAVDSTSTTAYAQCQAADGPFTLASQEASTCQIYDNSLWNTPLPVDVGSFKASYSAAVISGLFGRTQFIVQFHTPGSSDVGQMPVTYGQSSDPWWKIPLASCGSSPLHLECGISGTVGYAGDPSQSDGAIRFHAPIGTRWTGHAGTGNDSFMNVWDQTTNYRFQFYKSSGPNNNSLVQSSCTGADAANACAVPGGGYSVQVVTNSATGADVYRISNSSDSLHNANQGLLIRHAELIAGTINHAIYLNMPCENTGNVFPALVNGSGQAFECADWAGHTSEASTAPYHGQLFFVDYSDAEITAMAGIGAVHKTILKALAHYGGYAGDTSTVQLVFPTRIESMQAWYDSGVACGTPGTPCGDNTPVATARANVPVLDYLMDDGLTCSIDGSTLCKMTVDLDTTPLVGGTGIASHIHLADPCIPLGMAGLSGGCGTATTQPNHLTVVVQPSTVTVSTAISPSITVQIQDEDNMNVATAGVTVTASLSPVTGCTGVLGGDNTKATSAGGLATFNDLTVSISGTCQLSFSATDYTSTISNVFSVNDTVLPTTPGTVSIDGTPAVTAASGNVTSLTHSFTIGSNSNRLLIACGAVDSGLLETDQMLFNTDTPMTLIARGFSPAGGVSTSAWYMLAPTVGSATVTLDVGFSSRPIVGVLSLYNVNQTTPFRDIDSDDATESGEAAASTLTLTSVANDFLFGCLGAGRDQNPADLVPGASFTQKWDTSVVTDPDTYRSALATRDASGSTVASVWTWTNSTNFSHVAGTVIPISAIDAVAVTKLYNNAATFTWTTTIGGSCFLTYSLDGGTVWLPVASGITCNDGTYTVSTSDQSGIRQKFPTMKACISSGALCTSTFAPYGPFAMESILPVVQ